MLFWWEMKNHVALFLAHPCSTIYLSSRRYLVKFLVLNRLAVLLELAVMIPEREIRDFY